MTTLKRVFDLAGAAGGLLLFGPVMAVIATAIRLDDGRPVLFRQTRVGLRRRPFTILKFRTMRDGRVTRVGRVLRATGLDEVAQFANILRGDMSAVGPRPLTPADVERFGWTTRAHDVRWSVRPGLTGIAQLVGPPTAAEALALDEHYARRWRPLADVACIGLSFVVNVAGKTRVRGWLAAGRGIRVAPDRR